MVINVILSHQIVQLESKSSSSFSCCCFALFPCIQSLTVVFIISSPVHSPHSKPVLLILEAREAQTHGLDAPLLCSNWRSRCAREETERRLAHFYSLITFTGPQSHLRNHGDADKVTHDYSSMALPDWTAPESLAKRIHQRSLCPCSTSICPSG